MKAVKNFLKGEVVTIAVILILTISFECSKFYTENNIYFSNSQRFSSLIDPDELFMRQVNRTNTNSCPTCNFESVFKPGNSTTRDVVICFAFQRIIGLLPFLRTFRVVSNATFVLMVDKKVWEDMNPITKQVVYECGGVIYHADYNVKYFLTKRPMYKSKIHMYMEFLERHINVIDRVICIDLEDTVFQTDPFRSDGLLPNDRIVMFQEKGLLGGQRTTKKDLLRIKVPNFWGDMEFKRVINGAILYGPASKVYPFLKIIDFELGTNCKGLYDQAIFNEYKYTFDYPAFDVMYGRIITMSGFRDQNVKGMKLGNITVAVKEVLPLIGIHHTFHSDDLMEIIYKTCPAGEYPKEGYIRGISEKRMKELDLESKK